MYEYEKKIAQTERKDPQIVYQVKAYPTSKAGELAFSIAQTNEYQEIDCEVTFFYKDPNETEEERLEIVHEKIPQIMGRKRVAGFSDNGGYYNGTTYLWSFDQFKETGQMGGRHNNIRFKEDWDYDVKKIEYDESDQLSVDDIKAL